MTPDEEIEESIEKDVETGNINEEEEIDSNTATAVIPEINEEKKEVIDSFEITQEEICDPLTMNCEELQKEAQKLTKQSEILNNALTAFDKENPLFEKMTIEKTKIDDNLTKVFDRAFGTCLTPKPDEKTEETD